MLRLEIFDGWFRAAGNVYKWTPMHHIFGVGINLDILNRNSKIQIVVNDSLYDLDCSEALKFIDNYKSIKKVRRGVTLGVISKSLLTHLATRNVVSVEPQPTAKEVKQDEQMSLF